MAHPGGRPPLYDDPFKLKEAVDKYFEQTGIKFTLSGLAYFLGYESRQSCYDNEDNPEFSYIIKRAKFRIEQMYEELVQGTTPTGAIFVLKNMGWKDKTEQDLNVAGAMGITWHEERTYLTKESVPSVLHTKGGDVHKWD